MMINLSGSKQTLGDEQENSGPSVFLTDGDEKTHLWG